MWKNVKQNGKDISGCSIFGVMSEEGNLVNGSKVIDAIEVMHERSNGLGGGFAAYGIYPEYKDFYALHVIFEDRSSMESLESFLNEKAVIVKGEDIPTRKRVLEGPKPILRRYFVEVPKSKLNYGETEEDYIIKTVMGINDKLNGAYVVSSGKNMGVFKGVGYPEDIGRYFRLENYDAYLWTAHGRFPTNTPGWWGGAHPFALLDWAVVHNGELSSYGINKRYVEMFDYKCNLMTDTEVIVYILDLILRKHELPLNLALKVLSPPFWESINRMDKNEQEAMTVLRMVYSSTMLNGPFSVLISNSDFMIGLTDRIMLRPLVHARKDDCVYMSSEEVAIREICPEPDEISSADGCKPIIAKLRR